MNAERCNGFDLEDLLDKELRVRLGKIVGPHPEVGQSTYAAVFQAEGRPDSGPFSFTGLSSLAVGLVMLGLLTAAGSATAIASTGNASPMVWGRTVTSAVAACKEQLTDGQHASGQCVSAVAKVHGEQQHLSPQPTPLENSIDDARPGDGARSAVGSNQPPGPKTLPTAELGGPPGPKPTTEPPGQSGDHRAGHSNAHGGGQSGDHGHGQVDAQGGGQSKKGGGGNSASNSQRVKPSSPPTP
jgi:hypothetical protein